MPDFQKTMQNLPSRKLLEITTELADQYDPEAVKAAMSELQQRVERGEDIQRVKEEMELEKGWDQHQSEKGLSTLAKILFFILATSLIGFIFAFIYKGNGQEKKFKEAIKISVIGIVFWFGIPILFAIIAVAT